MTTPDPITVVFAIFPGVTHLDFTGPHQVLTRVPGAEVRVASLDGAPIAVEGGLAFSGLARLSDIPRCDVLCVPGGAGVTPTMENPAFLGEIRRLAADARYVTSVCSGSLILGAAGLLKGRRAASHWNSRELLSLFGAIPDPGRVVRDGNVFTGGGVTAGIDFALTLAAELSGLETAQAIQLYLEYAPEPPFSAGRPETAPEAVLTRAREGLAAASPDRRAAAERAAAALA